MKRVEERYEFYYVKITFDFVYLIFTMGRSSAAEMGVETGDRTRDAQSRFERLPREALTRSTGSRRLR
jgi:hypothetical protein